MSFSKDSITSRYFSKQVFGGLSEFEVRDFLHVLAEEIRHLNQLQKNLKEKVASLEEQVKDHRDREHILKRSIVSAQEVADKIQKDTEQKSQMIIARAQDKSTNLIRETRESLKSVYSDISGLRRLHLQFKNSLKANLKSQLEFLEESPLFSLPKETVEQTEVDDLIEQEEEREEILQTPSPQQEEGPVSKQLENLKESLKSLEKDFL